MDTFQDLLLFVLLVTLAEHVLLCVKAAAIFCAPIMAAYFIWSVVRRINRRDESQNAKRMPEEAAGLMPIESAFLKSRLWRIGSRHDHRLH